MNLATENVLKTATAGESIHEGEMYVNFRCRVGKVHLTCASLFLLTAEEDCKQINGTMNMVCRVNSWLRVAGVIQGGVGHDVKTVCGCPDVSMAPAISPGSAPAWTGGRGDSATKVINYS